MLTDSEARPGGRTWSTRDNNHLVSRKMNNVRYPS